MKVKVKDLRANPFRQIDKYPIIYDKVEKLKNSIAETSFWDNILARPRDDVFEIAYGHHRLKAIRELGIEEVDIPVRDLDDKTMIKVMANENMEDWEPDTKVINETVRVVRDFLAGLAGPQSERVTSTDIQSFLGDNWSLKRVKQALASLDEKQYDREAVETFRNPTHSNTFRHSIAQLNRQAETQQREPFIPKEEQREVAHAVMSQVQSEAKQTGRDPELTSDKIREGVYNYAKEKVKQAGGGQRHHTAVVADAYWVQVAADLAAIKKRAQGIVAPLSEISEKHKDQYRKYVSEICQTLEGFIDE